MCPLYWHPRGAPRQENPFVFVFVLFLGGWGLSQVLLANDQLSMEMKAKRVFEDFVEGPITFPPTYKFDAGEYKILSAEDGAFLLFILITARLSLPRIACSCGCYLFCCTWVSVLYLCSLVLFLRVTIA